MKYLKNLRMSRRAVSPIIATLLLIAISVAAAVVTYTFVMNMVSNQGNQAQTAIRIDQVQFGSDGATKSGIVVSIRNTGTVPATIQTLYVYRGGALIVTKDGINTALGATTLGTFGFKSEAAWTGITSGGIVLSSATYTSDALGAFGANLVRNGAYSVKIVTDNGFVIEGTYYAPSSW